MRMDVVALTMEWRTPYAACRTLYASESVQLVGDKLNPLVNANRTLWFWWLLVESPPREMYFTSQGYTGHCQQSFTLTHLPPYLVYTHLTLGLLQYRENSTTACAIACSFWVVRYLDQIDRRGSSLDNIFNSCL